jgi:hypothetical protein
MYTESEAGRGGLFRFFADVHAEPSLLTVRPPSC